MKIRNFLLAASLLTAAASPAFGATSLDWDGSNTGNAVADGGTGTWDANSTANWWTTGPSDVTWTDTTGTDTAVFGNTAGTVTISGGVTANALHFTTTGYTLTGGSLTLAGTTPTITTATGTTTLSSVVAGSAGLTKAGVGTLALTGANTYTGGTTVSGGTLFWSGGTYFNIARTTTIASGAVFELNNSNNTFSTSMPTGASVNGAGTFRLSGTTTLNQSAGGSGGTRLTFAMSAGGLIDLQGTSKLTNGGWQEFDWTNNKASMNIAGGATLDMWDGNTVYVDALTGTGTVDKGINTASTLLTVGVANGSGTFGGTIKNTTGTVAFAKNGTGTQTLTGVNTYTGGTTVNAGTLKLDLSGRGGQVTLGAFTIASSGVLELYNTATGTDNFLGQNTTYSGTGTLRKTGAGNLDIAWNGSNINGFNGLLDVQAGTLCFNNGTQGSGKATLQIASGAAVDVRTGALQVDALNGVAGSSISSSHAASTLSVGNNNGSGSFAGAIQNGAGIYFIKNGAGTQTLSGANTYTGSTTVNGGRLVIANSWASATNTVNAGGTLELNRVANYNFAANQQVTGTGVLQFTGGAMVTIGNAGGTKLNLSAGGVIDVQNGDLNIGWSQGTLATNQGGLNLGAAGHIHNSDTAMQVDWLTGSGTLDNAYSANVLALTIGGSNTTNNAAYGVTGNTAVFSGTIGGTTTYNTVGIASVSVTKTGTGTQVFTGANAYTGGTTINGGALNARNNLALGTGAVSVTAGALQLQGGLAGVGNALTLVGTGIANAGALENVSGNNTWSGVVTIGAGGASIGSDAGQLNLTGAVSVANALTFTGAGITRVSGVVSGSAGITQSGTGTLFLSGSNGGYTGAVNVAAGKLVVTSANGLGTGDVTVGTGTTLAYQAASDAALAVGGTLSLADGATLGASVGSTGSSSQITVAGAATATGAITVNLHGTPGTVASTGTYTLVHGGAGSSLAGATYTLGSIVYNNTNFTLTSGLAATGTDLTVGIASATALTDAYWRGGFAGGSVWAGSDGTANSNWSATAGGAVQALVPGNGATVRIATSPIVAATATTLGADMSIAGLSIEDTANAFALNGDGHALTIGSGGVTVAASVPAATIAANLVLGATQTWTNGSANVLTVSGGISGANNLTVNGPFTLSGGNTYTGTTSVTGGTLQIAGAGVLGAGNYAQAISLGANTTLRYSSTANQTFSGAISGSGALVKDTGSGTLTLSGANTGFTGNVTLGAGTLRVSGASALGTANDVTVAANSANVTLLLNAQATIKSLTVGANVTGATLVGGNNVWAPAIAGTVTLGSALTLTALSGAVGNNGVALRGKITGTGVAAGQTALILNANSVGAFYWENESTVANDFTGNVRITGGTVRFQQFNAYTNIALPTASLLIVDSGSTLYYNNINQNNGTIATETFDGLSGAGSINTTGRGTYTINANNTANDSQRSFSGSITGLAGNLTFGGTGTQEFKGANLNYANTTALNNGTLKLTDTTAWASAITLGASNTPKLQLNYSGAANFGKIISGGSSGATVEKIGAGNLTLTALNTYVGNTVVTQGTLTVGTGGQILLTSAGGVSVASGATLALSGTGILKMGSDSATIANAGTFSGSGTLDLGNLFNGWNGGVSGSYTLVSGSGTDTASLTVLSTSYDTNVWNSVIFDNANGALVFTAVPEPSTYGLLGAGALAAITFVRRRRRRLV